jgi:hypothetical protein
MVNPRRAEIFALPHPLDAIDDARDNFHSSIRRCSSVVEQRIRNARVVGSIPTTGLSHFSSRTALRLDSRAELPERSVRSIAQHFAPKRNFIAKFLPSNQGRSREFIPALLLPFATLPVRPCGRALGLLVCHGSKEQSEAAWLSRPFAY